MNLNILPSFLENDGNIEVGRDIWGYLVQYPAKSQVKTDGFLRGHIQSNFEYLQEWRFHSTFSEFDHPHSFLFFSPLGKKSPVT